MMGDVVYDSRSIASYLVNRSGAKGLTALQIMKLTYIAHGFTLGVHDRPLLEDEVEAWQHGPVIRSVYNELPGGSLPIKSFKVAPADLLQDDHVTVDGVFNTYGHLSGPHLSYLTHRPGSPWDLTWRNFGKNAVIPKHLITGHYKKIVYEWNSASKAGTAYTPSSF